MVKGKRKNFQIYTFTSHCCIQHIPVIIVSTGICITANFLSGLNGAYMKHINESVNAGLIDFMVGREGF
jgi:hypothetical protein